MMQGRRQGYFHTFPGVVLLYDAPIFPFWAWWAFLGLPLPPLPPQISIKNQDPTNGFKCFWNGDEDERRMPDKHL
jgi:hypothetical protein